MMRKSIVSTLVLILAVSASSCSSGSNSTYTSTVASSSFEEEINKYSDELVVRANNAISTPSQPKKTTDTPTYVITYVIEKDELKTRKDADVNPTSYAINTGITKLWSNLFCTDELKGIMHDYDVFMVSGQLIDQKGEKYSLSACMK